MIHGCQKDFHVMEMQPGTCMWSSPRYFVDPEDASKYANFRVPAMDRREQMELESSFLMKQSKEFDFING